MSILFSQADLLQQQLEPLLRTELSSLSNAQYQYYIRSALASEVELLALWDQENHLDSWTASLLKNSTPECTQVLPAEISELGLTALLQVDKPYLYQVKLPAFNFGWVIERVARVQGAKKEPEANPEPNLRALALVIKEQAEELQVSLQQHLAKEIQLRMQPLYYNSELDLNQEVQKNKKIKQAFAKFAALAESELTPDYYLNREREVSLALAREAATSYPHSPNNHHSSYNPNSPLAKKTQLVEALYQLCKGELATLLSPYLNAQALQDLLATTSSKTTSTNPSMVSKSQSFKANTRSIQQQSPHPHQEQQNKQASQSKETIPDEEILFLLTEAKKLFYRQLSTPALHHLLLKLSLPASRVAPWLQAESFAFFVFTQKFLQEELLREEAYLHYLPKLKEGKAEQQREILAYTFLGYGDVYLEINNLAVNKKYRGLGLSKLLMTTIIHLGSKLAVDNIELEVRESNTPAITLYRDFGFKPWKVLEHYYATSTAKGSRGEDALAMSLKPPLIEEALPVSKTNPHQEESKAEPSSSLDSSQQRDFIYLNDFSLNTK